MRGIPMLLLATALACGVWRASEATKSKHFETVYSWSEIDFVMPDEETRTAMIANHLFVSGAAVPVDFKMEAATGRMFVTTPKLRPGVPYTLSTVSDVKSANNEHMLLPYPDYSMHSKGCDGITSVGAITVDECGRLWVVDMGSVYTDGIMQGLSQICPVKLMVFDLKTNYLVKEHKFPDRIVTVDSGYANIVVDVGSSENECRDTFAYIANSGYFHMIVYDLAHDDHWTVESNTMYPYPEFGHFHYKGVHFDVMFGIFGMALSPKHANGGDRTLYFNSIASGKDSYVATSLLKNKTYFAKDASHDMHYYVYSHFHTYPAPRPGGPSSMGPIVNDVLFYGSYHESSIYCWNHKAAYEHDNIVQVDKDEDAFDMFAKFSMLIQDGSVPQLYVMSNSLEKFFYDQPLHHGETLFRISRASIDKLIEDTGCGNVVTA